MRRLFVVTAFLAGFAVFQPRPAEAFLITGELDLGGGVRITSGGLMDFIPPIDPSTTGCPGGSDCGVEQISLVTNTDYFSAFNGGAFFGTIPIGAYNIAELDLLATVATASGCTPAQAAAFPGFCGDFTAIADFETTPDSIQPLNAIFGTPSPLPELTFSLASISACTVGCGFGFAPQFNVTFTNGNTAIIMNVRGVVCDPGTVGAECNNYTGIFTAQFPGRSPASLIAELDANGYIQTSFSASKISTERSEIPEPATLLLFGTGSAFLASRARRRAKAKKEANQG